MRTPQSSIRNILLLITGTLTLLIVTITGRDMVANWQRLTSVRALASASALNTRLFDATERLSFERDIVLSMLHAQDAATVASLEPRLQESRRAADNSLRAALASSEAYDFPELAALRNEIKHHFSAVQRLRREVDAAVRHPNDRRKAELSARWSDEGTALISDTENLAIGFAGHFAHIDPAATQQFWYKHFLRSVVDYTGRERSLIGQLIVENADPTPSQVAELLRGQGIAEQSWQMTRILAQQSGLYPAIAPAYRDARSQYATMHDMIRDMFYVPGARHRAVYPISIDLWFELSTQSSDALGVLQDVSLRQTRKYLDGLMRDSERQIALQAVLSIVALFLCALSVRVVILRVIRPIQVMIDALVRTSRGEWVDLKLPRNRDDEIASLADVLNAIREALEQVRRTAADLDQSESHLRAVVDHAMDGLITIDAAGSIRSFNHACEHIFGYDASEVVGRNVKMLMAGPGHDEEEEGSAFSLLRGTDEGAVGTTGQELTAKRKDGSIFPIDLSISSFLSGDARFFSGILRDITARKQVERALLQHSRALERSNKELDDFAYIASHDLKEPLRGIHNHARFLLEDNEGKLDAESTGRLGRLVFLSQRMERLVNDLLYFSRLGRQEMAIQSTDLVAVAADIESTLELFLKERCARIIVPARLPCVTCDRPRVSELLRNLITNAAKYNDKPDKLIEIGFLDSKANKDGQARERVFFVKDNGLGVAPEFHQDIFRIFKRLQASKEGEEGTGVGLTFVKKIVERHGGEIWLESESGKGTTFYFTLEAPRHERESEPKKAA
jgi:PAS domain S-box-containing protein